MVKYIVGIGLYMLKYSVLQHNFLDWDLFTELIRMKIYNMHYALCRLYFYKMRDRRHFFGLTTLSRCRKTCCDGEELCHYKPLLGLRHPNITKLSFCSIEFCLKIQKQCRIQVNDFNE